MDKKYLQLDLFNVLTNLSGAIFNVLRVLLKALKFITILAWYSYAVIEKVLFLQFNKPNYRRRSVIKVIQSFKLFANFLVTISTIIFHIFVTSDDIFITKGKDITKFKEENK